MQNAAFAARGLDWAYVALDVPPEHLEDAVRGLAALGFAGANVTTPHKFAVAKLVGSELPSVNTLVGMEGFSTDTAILDGLDVRAAVRSSVTAARRCVQTCAPAGARLLPQGRVASRRDATPTS